MSTPPTRGAAKLMIVGGIAGAVVLPAVSWPAGLMCALIAGAGWLILQRGRPTSRWFFGWTAFRSRRRR